LHAPRQLLVDGSVLTLELGAYLRTAAGVLRLPGEKGSCKNSNENCKALAMTIDHPVRIAGSSRH
jgi:hypothetical protein